MRSATANKKKNIRLLSLSKHIGNQTTEKIIKTTKKKIHNTTTKQHRYYNYRIIHTPKLEANKYRQNTSRTYT